MIKILSVKMQLLLRVQHLLECHTLAIHIPTIHPQFLINIFILGKARRGAGDQWVKTRDGNWEIEGNFSEMPSIFSRDLHT